MTVPAHDTLAEAATAFVRAIDRYEAQEIGWKDVRPFLERLRSLAALRAGSGEECGRFYAHPAPLDYTFCRKPKGHDGACVFEPRAGSGDKNPSDSLDVSVANYSEPDTMWRKTVTVELAYDHEHPMNAYVRGLERDLTEAERKLRARFPHDDGGVDPPTEPECTVGAVPSVTETLRAIAEMPVRWPTDETAAMQEIARAALAAARPDTTKP